MTLFYLVLTVYVEVEYDIIVFDIDHFSHSYGEGTHLGLQHQATNGFRLELWACRLWAWVQLVWRHSDDRHAYLIHLQGECYWSLCLRVVRDDPVLSYLRGGDLWLSQSYTRYKKGPRKHIKSVIIFTLNILRDETHLIHDLDIK